jgi:hypothetical protein
MSARHLSFGRDGGMVNADFAVRTRLSGPETGQRFLRFRWCL